MRRVLFYYHSVIGVIGIGTLKSQPKKQNYHNVLANLIFQYIRLAKNILSNPQYCLPQQLVYYGILIQSCCFFPMQQIFTLSLHISYLSFTHHYKLAFYSSQTASWSDRIVLEETYLIPVIYYSLPPHQVLHNICMSS